MLPQLRRAFWLGALALISIGLTVTLVYWVNQRSVAALLEILSLLGILAWLSRRTLRQAKQLEATRAIADSAKSEHEEAQSLLDFCLNSSPVGFALHDRSMRFVRINEAGAAMSGLPAASHVGKTLEEVMPSDFVDAIEPILRRVLATGEAVPNIPIASTNLVDPMRERHYLASFFPVELSRGSTGVGSVILETTQYRQLEEQLLQARKMEAVGRLAGGVAHDFNNILTAIKSYSELLLADAEPGSQQSDDLLEITRAADRASALTRQLLAFSRQQQVLQPRLVNLNATVDGMRNMLKRLLFESVRINIRLARDLWMVTADPAELERVIMNFVLNARDAMPDGGQLILETSNVEIDEEYASSHAYTTPGPYVMLAVTDTGAGMSKEVRERLFEPFFTTKEKGKGTGLGLASVYGIIKQSGGFVRVDSEPERGTTFKVYIPRAEEAREGEGTDDSAAQPPRGQRDNSGRPGRRGGAQRRDADSQAERIAGPRGDP
ncbi:MAG: ATP-binding protein [Gemmatimonadaceae bacterium]|nr:ATP-binding protein [Gemmatimonadaceae bacterium]